MENASSLAEYEACTTHLDHLQGHDAWKDEASSIEPGYLPAEIAARMSALQDAVLSQDAEAMQRLIRTSLSRNLGGMAALRLYKHSWFGTKRLVDEYINTAVVTIETFVRAVSRSDATEDKVREHRSAIEDSLKFFGRSALTLSGGGALGMKHIGVAKCLWEAELLPNIISGASAGSIVAAIIGTSTDNEMPDVLEHFPYSNLAVFDPAGTRGIGWSASRLTHFAKTWAFFDPEYLSTVMQEWLKDITFGEAYNKTRRVLNVCVSSIEGEEPIMLNYISTPDVLIWSAVCASCAVPLVFPGANIYEKDSRTKETRLWMQNMRQVFVDGSLDSDIPARKLAEQFNVNFFIVSQVNPHVRIALTAEETFVGKQPTRPRPRRRVMTVLKDVARQELLYRVDQIADPNPPSGILRCTSLLKQQYTGDINIFPQIDANDYLSTMANPTPEFMLRSLREGEQATWPKMCRIKNCVDIELALIQGHRDLSDRLHFSPDARAARELEQVARCGRSGRGRSARPHFLRRLSSDDEDWRDHADGTLRQRRNASLGDIVIGADRLRPLQPLLSLSPQAGVGDPFADGLMMTTVERWPKKSSKPPVLLLG